MIDAADWGLLRQLVADQVRVGVRAAVQGGTVGVPAFRVGTLLAWSGQTARVLVDGDVDAIDVQNTRGTFVTVGTRVQVLFDPPHGVFLVGRLGINSTPYGSCHVYLTGTQNMAAAATNTWITYNAVRYDYGSNYTLGANPYYTAPWTGLYHIDAKIEYQINNSPDDVFFKVSWGTAPTEIVMHRSVIRGATALDAVTMHGSVTIPALVGDHVYIRVFHNQGGNVQTMQGDAYFVIDPVT